MMDNDELDSKLAMLKARLADLEARMPAHSVPPAMVMEMEDLEEEIAALNRSKGSRG